MGAVVRNRGRLRAGLVGAGLVAVLTATMPQGFAAVYSSPVTGAHEVKGAILARYQATGGPTGPLGYPTTDERATPNGKGRYNAFQRGSIHFTPATGAHAVLGSIGKTWTALG